MRGIPLFLFTLVAACGFDEERFLVNGVDLWCERSAECDGGFEKDACVDVFRTTDRSACTYDAEQGLACFQDLPEAACVEDDLLDIRYLEVPESCEAVYSCPEE